jgi:hypothetical protein
MDGKMKGGLVATMSSITNPKFRRRSRLSALLLYLAMKTGVDHEILIPGRCSGKTRTTPVPLVQMNGRQYIIGSSPRSNWVKDARAAGWGILRSGGTKTLVPLRELSVEEKLPVLRELARQTPTGDRRIHLPRDPDAWIAVAPWYPVFCAGVISLSDG